MAASLHDVTVLGAGIAGLTTALVLRRRGHRVRIVTADDAANTTSNVAAGAWFPTRVGPPEDVVRWGRRTFDVLTAMAGAEPGAGVALRETLSLYREDPGRPWWTDALGDVAEVGPAGLPTGYRHGLRYVVPLAEMPVHLPWLLGELRGAGVVVERHRVSQLSELGGTSAVIVNCTGLAAGALVGDGSVVPVRGQIVRTTNPGLARSVRDEHHPGGYTYVHPRSQDCILGGSLEDGVWDTTPDHEVGEAILRRCRELAPELERAEVLEHRVGLRPGRPTVRLELDTRALTETPVVHNYGHGGAGVTLAWGCAEDVAGIVGSVLDA